MKREDPPDSDSGDVQLTLSITGARDGDLIKGNRGSSAEGGLFRIRFQEGDVAIPPGREKEVRGRYLAPCKKMVDAIRGQTSQFKQVLEKLRAFPLFAEANSSDVAATLENIQCGVGGKSINIGWNFGGWVAFEVLRLPKKVEGLLPSDVLDTIPTSLWVLEDLMELIPAKTATVQLERRTLAFQMGNWQACFSESRGSAEKGNLVIDIESGQVLDGSHASPVHELWPMENFPRSYEKKTGKWVAKRSLSFFIRAPKIAFNVGEVSSVNCLVDAVGVIASKGEVEAAVQALRGFEQNASVLKSCLQKLIRFQPLECSISFGNPEARHVKAQVVLIVVVWLLFRCKGGFIPDLQTWTSGLESLTKRLGVILFEDSSFIDEHDAVRLLGAALLAQRVPEWKPNDALLIMWCKIALGAQANNVAYEYDCDFDGKPHVISEETISRPLALASALLDECGSFQGDLKMARDIAGSRTLKNVRQGFGGSANRPSVMRFPDHCIDQHTSPSMVYFFPRDTVDEVCEAARLNSGGVSSGAPFAPMMSHIFRVTGTNPRRHPQNFQNFDAENKIVREAQRLMLAALRFASENQRQRDSVGKARFKPGPLSHGWLAAMIGGIEEKLKRNFLVTCTPSDPTKLVAIPAPARDKSRKQDQHSDDGLIETAVENARAKLRRGVLLRDVPIKELEGCEAKLVPCGDSNDDDDDDVAEECFEIISRNGEKSISWQDFRQLPERDVSLHKRMQFSLTAAYETCGTGMEDGAFETLEHVVGGVERESVLRRLMIYTACRGKAFRMNLVSRDGSYLKYAVVLDDVDVFQLLLRFCCLFPGALGISKEPFEFVVKDRLLFWKIDEVVKAELQKRNVAGSLVSSWPKMNDSRKYLPKPHQTESIGILLDKFNIGSKGSFLYMTVGMGKTLVVMQFLCKLQELGQIPGYVFFVVPKSAALAVLQEIVAFGVQCDLVSPSQSSTLQNRIAESVPKGVKCVALGQLRKKRGVDGAKASEIRSGVVTVIEDDDLIGLQQELADLVSDSIFVVDEVHKKMALTLRTSAALQLARLSRFFVALTGTPIIDSRATGLAEWLEMIVDFEVNPKNMWVAANEMISYKISTGVIVESLNVAADFTSEEQEKNRRLTPVRMGGANSHAKNCDFQDLTDLAYTACTRKMVALTLEFLERGEGPGGCSYFVVIEFPSSSRAEDDKVTASLEFRTDTSSPPVWSLHGRVESNAPVIRLNVHQSQKGDATFDCQIPVDANGGFKWNTLDRGWVKAFRRGRVKISIACGGDSGGGDGGDEISGGSLGSHKKARKKRDRSTAGDGLFEAATVPPIFKQESVMIVARNQGHASQISSLLASSGKIRKADIHVGSHNLTDYLVEQKEASDYRVVIVPISEETGYTLTRLGVQISSVYPSNQAKREQIEGRINRIGQQRSTIQYRTVHCGILTYILENHQKAKSLSAALAEIAKSVVDYEIKII